MKTVILAGGKGTKTQVIHYDLSKASDADKR